MPKPQPPDRPTSQPAALHTRVANHILRWLRVWLPYVVAAGALGAFMALLAVTPALPTPGAAAIGLLAMTIVAVVVGRTLLTWILRRRNRPHE